MPGHGTDSEEHPTGNPTKIEITDDHVWCALGTLGEVGAELVRRLRENGNGHPGSLSSMDEWNAILAGIEDGFRVLVEEAEEGPMVTDAGRIRWERGCDLLKTWAFDLWD